VVVVAAEEFERLRKLDAKPRINFVEFLLSGPKSEEGIEIPPAEIRARDADL